MIRESAINFRLFEKYWVREATSYEAVNEQVQFEAKRTGWYNSATGMA